MQLLTLMDTLRNHFIQGTATGTFRIREGRITPAPFHPPAPWLLWDGQLYPLDQEGKYPTLPDGTLSATLYACHPPAPILTLAEDITAWEAGRNDSSVQSEALGEYRVTYHAPTAGGWQQAFAPRLAPYRRMFSEVNG